MSLFVNRIKIVWSSFERLLQSSLHDSTRKKRVETINKKNVQKSREETLSLYLSELIVLSD
jgi:hypothetical protein